MMSKNNLLKLKISWTQAAFVLFFIFVFAVAGCGKKVKPERPPVPVVSVVASEADVPLYIESVGRCVAFESVDIVPRVGGQIVEVKFKQGQIVKAGDPLYLIDPRQYEANLKKAEAQLSSAQAKFKLDASQLERSKALLPQNYISQQQYEAYESQVERDGADVAIAGAQVDQAKLDLEHCNIVSPIAGMTGGYLVDVGNIVGPMAIGKPLVTVQNVDLLYVEFSVSENDFYNLQKFFKLGGNELKAEVFPISGEELKGEAFVDFINNAINEKTGSVKLRALMQNRDHRFWPGQSVKAKLLLTTLKGAVLIPYESVKLGQNGHYVFVVKDDKSVELRLVEIGQMHKNMIIINNGISAGDIVVRQGQLMLAPGAKVIEVPYTQSGVFKHDMEHDKKVAEKNPTTK